MSEADKAADSTSQVSPKEERGTKRPVSDDAPDSTTKVHSANEWEKVDLGDTDRKQKFLRLMGASKKEHHGRFVIGEQVKNTHGEHDEDKHRSDELETQYEHSMDYRLKGGQRVHRGLGFQKDDDQGGQPDSSGDTKQETPEQEESKVEGGSEAEKGPASEEGEIVDSSGEASSSSSDNGKKDSEDDSDNGKKDSEDEAPDSSVPSKYKMTFVKSSS